MIAYSVPPTPTTGCVDQRDIIRMNSLNLQVPRTQRVSDRATGYMNNSFGYQHIYPNIGLGNNAEFEGRRVSTWSVDSGGPLYTPKRKPEKENKEETEDREEDIPDFISKPSIILRRSLRRESTMDSDKESSYEDFGPNVRFASEDLSHFSLGSQALSRTSSKNTSHDTTDYNRTIHVPEDPDSVMTGSDSTSMDGMTGVTGQGVEKTYTDHNKTAPETPTITRKRKTLKTMDVGRRNHCRFHTTVREDTIERQVRSYGKKLETHSSDVLFLKEELHNAAFDDEVNKIRVLCGFLISKRHSLCENDMLGSQYKETALDVAIVKGSTESARVLIDFGTAELVCKPYSTKQYAGVTPLHLAVIKQNPNLVEYMLNVLDDKTRLELINSKATGRYFKDKYTCPWVPLSLAVGIGDIGIFNTLLQHGANLLAVDNETGDTVLHNLARVSMKVPHKADQMLRLILRSQYVTAWWQENRPDCEEGPARVLLHTKNKAGYTPMSYAVFLGATQFATTILDIIDIYTFPQWHVGPEQANLYEVSEIDPAVASEKCQVPSVLEMYTFATNDSKLDFGKVPHIYQTMMNKWKAYRGWFLAWFVYHFMVMAAFTIYSTHTHIPSVLVLSFTNSINQTNYSYSTTDTYDSPTWKNHAILALELFILSSALLYLILDIYDTFSLITKHFIRVRTPVHARRKYMIWVSAQFDVMRFTLFLYSVSVLMLFILRLEDSIYQDVFFTIAAITGWMFMLFFVRSLRKIGIFTAMLYRMITHELSYFLVLFVIGLTAHTTALFTLFNLNPGQNPDAVSSYMKTSFTLFKVIVGLDEFMILEETRQPFIAQVAFTTLVLFCHILLLNMLIAAMNNTYNRLSVTKEILWLQLRTKAVLLIERRLPHCLRPKHKLLQDDTAEMDRKSVNRGLTSQKKWYLACEEAERDHPLTNFGFDDDVLSTR